MDGWMKVAEGVVKKEGGGDGAGEREDGDVEENRRD